MGCYMDELRYQVDLLNAMNQRMQDENQMYRSICDTSENAVLYYNFRTGMVKVIGGWDTFFEGVTINNSADFAKLYSYVEDHSVLLFRELLFLENTKENRRVCTFKIAGCNKYFDCRVNVNYDSDLQPVDKVIRFIDVTKKKSQNDELEYLAYYDLMTGLYNRNYFVRLLGDFVRRAEDENGIVSVMFLDLDDFHSINDGMGLVFGDEVVQQFGFLLNSFKKDNVLVSHFNADIYCMAVFDPSVDDTPDQIFHYLKNRLRTPLRLSDGSEVLISFCMGVAEYPEAALSSLDLINCAEIVMLKAKRKGRGEIQYFDAPILQDFINNVSIENKLKSAVFDNNFTMNFQPQFYADTRNLRGVEALIRWKDSEGKNISPAVFIPIAEKNGTIIPIGAFVLDESIKAFARLKKEFSVDFKMSINISAIQYRRENFVDDVLSTIRKYGVDPSNIELEITESVFIDDFKDMVEKLMILREYGIKISLDDFGTGYSSLSYLRGLPIDTLKIDKSFVDFINQEDDARVILETIIFMSKKLGFETIAEGVEDIIQFDYIKKIGCDCIQGYFLSKPLTEDDLEKLLLEISLRQN